MSLEHSETSQMLLTPEGYEALQAELERLTVDKRAEIANRIRESKEHGEFSEDNSELDEIKVEQAIVENRIAELKTIFAGAQVLDAADIPTDRVGIGSFVEVQDLDRKTKFEVRLVASIEADPDRDFISVESPMGRALFGCKRGDEVSFEAPAGLIKYKILRIHA